MLILILLLLPLITAIAIAVIPGISGQLSKNIGGGISLVNFLIFIYGLIQFQKGDTVLLDYSHVWLSNANINFSLSADGISQVLLGLVTFITMVVIHIAGSFDYKQSSLLYILILLTESALIGVFTATDIFLFYFFFEISLIPVYFLALKWGGENAPKITFRMFVYTIFGSLLMLSAIIFLYTKGQTASIQELAITGKALPKNVNILLFLAFIVAFGIKMPMFPFHTWQPDAYTESPTPATILLAALLSKMGVYGLLRIALPLAPIGWNQLGIYIVILAIFGLIYGSIIAIKQNNLKKILAYSSFAHMGLMAAGILTGNLSGTQGAVIQMLAHGINVAGLFYIVKIIQDRTGSRNLEGLGGLSQKAPVLTVLFMIVLLGSVALPLTNGFVGEFLLLKSVFDYNNTLGVIAGLTIIFGAVYMLRMMQKAMFGQLLPANENILDVNKSELMVLVPICLLVILFGMFPNLILNSTVEAAKAFTQLMSNI